MTTCTNCNGEGLAGAGDKPWLKQGTIHTCNHCQGTGQLDETGSPTPVADDQAQAGGNTDTVDNSQSASDAEASNVGAEVQSADTSAHSQDEEVNPITLGNAGSITEPGETQTGPFQNLQVFEIGQKIEFHQLQGDYAGIHTILQIAPVPVGTVLLTDRSNGNWIHAHWFQPAPVE